MFDWLIKWYVRRKARIERDRMLGDELREKGLFIRRLQAQINALEKQVEMKQRLSVLEDTLSAGKSDGKNFEEQIALAILNKFINPAPAVQHMQKEIEKTHLSDEQIETFIRQNNYLVKNIAELGLTENEIKAEIRQKAPDLDDDTIDRAAKIFLIHVKEVS